MNFREYAILALKTKSPSINILEDLQHASAGLVTEVGEIIDILKRRQFYKKEIDTTHLLEEIGDVYWYMAVASLVYNYYDWQVKEVNSLPSLEILVARASTQASYMYSIAYSRSDEVFDYDLDFALVAIYQALSDLCLSFGFEKEIVWAKNIAKLKARYGDKFSEEAALTRNLENEKEVLNAN